MVHLRQATFDDAALIASHRHRMFADNEFAPEARLDAMDQSFEPWVRGHLADGSYLGLLLEEDGYVVAGAGVYFMEFPPHWMHDEAMRAYLLNVYTEPEARGRGYAKRLVQALMKAARERGTTVMTLHASPQGAPIYRSLGFKLTVEMIRVS